MFAISARPVTFTGYGWTTDQPYTGETLSSIDFSVEAESEDRGLLADHTLSGVSYSISGTAVGEYTGEFTGTPVVTAGEDATDLSSNYAFSYDEGTLNIVASPIADYVTLDTTDVVQTYDGTAYAAGAATATDANGNDAVVEYSVNGTDWTTDPSTITATNVADSVTVQVRASVPGTYTGYATGTQQLTINPRPVTITVADASKVFGDADPTFSPADMAGQVEGELTDVDLSVHRTNADEAAAVYENVLTINPTDAELEADYGNYDFSIHNGDFTITAQSITPGPDPENPDPTYREVTVDYPQDASYNGVDQTWVPTVTDAEDNLLTAGEDYEVSYSTDDRTNVTGIITVTITGKGNYPARSRVSTRSPRWRSTSTSRARPRSRARPIRRSPSTMRASSRASRWAGPARSSATPARRLAPTASLRAGSSWPTTRPETSLPVTTR